jgi:hypothetical protein
MVTRIVSGWKEIPTTSTPSGTAVPVVQDPTAIPWIVSSTEFPIGVLATGSTSVSVDTQTTIVSFTATSADKNITKITGSSEFPGEYQLFKNTVLQDTLYTGGGGGLNAIFILENWELVATDIIDVKYEHGFNGKTPTVYATVWGY